MFRNLHKMWLLKRIFVQGVNMLENKSLHKTKTDPVHIKTVGVNLNQSRLCILFPCRDWVGLESLHGGSVGIQWPQDSQAEPNPKAALWP